MELQILDTLPLIWVTTKTGKTCTRALELVEFLGKSSKDTARLVLLNVFPEYRFQSNLGEKKRSSWYLTKKGALQLIMKIGTPESEKIQRLFVEALVKNPRVMESLGTSVD